ncbi:26013_t:CDS:2, partial [Gigaspora margarita]
RLKRQAKCTTLTTDITLTTSAASSPGCAYNIAAPTVTAVSCGSCDSSGSSAAAPAQFLKRQDSSCITVTTNISTIITTASCTVTVVAPTATVTAWKFNWKNGKN